MVGCRRWVWATIQPLAANTRPFQIAFAGNPRIHDGKVVPCWNRLGAIPVVNNHSGSSTAANTTRIPIHKKAHPINTDRVAKNGCDRKSRRTEQVMAAVSYTHLRAHETPEHLVCRLL